MDNNYKVYQHVTPDGMYYFGQTQNVEKRWSNNGAGYKGTSLQPYIEQYGWDNIQHIVLFKDQTKENALWIEDFLITTAREDGVCINQRRSGYVSKEEGYHKNQCNQYYETNKDNIREQQKQYYETNKEQILEQQKQYYETNKDKKREYNRQYREQNREKYNESQREYNRKYREQNKDKFRKYHREYYQRKKLEKQLKEAVETTLF